MSSADRSGLVAAVSISLALHAGGAIWFALRPAMFRTARPPAPIAVTLVPARPLPLPGGGGGGTSPAPEKLVREVPPDKLSRPARARPPRTAAPPPPATPQLPRAAAVDPAPSSAQVPDDALAAASVGTADLGIGDGGGAGRGPGSGGGSGGGQGGGVGAGTGAGSGPGGGVEVKPRELRRPSFAEMRALYPEDARRDGVQARVRLQLLVDVSGRVADVRVVRGAGRGFDEAAVSLARRFLFAPGTRDGRPVPMWITLTYSFEIEG